MTMDPVKILPTEVFEKILSYLTLKELMPCCLVSQKWNIAANNDSLWRKLCLENNWSDCGSLKDHINRFGFLTSVEKDAFLNMGEWRKQFVLQNQLQNNWHTGNYKDFILSPVDNDGNVSCVSSDGHSILAFGLDSGVLKLFNLKEEGKLIVTKECTLATPITHIQILNDYVFVMQNYLFQTFKLNEDYYLDLCYIKIINESLIVSVDIPTLMILDRKDRLVVINESIIDGFTIYHFNDNYLVVASAYSHVVNVYDLKYDFIEPDITFNLNTNLANSFIFNLHINGDMLCVLMGEFQSISMQAYSLRSKTLLFEEKITESFKLASRECSIESNALYIVIKFDLNTFFLLERATGRVVSDGNGIIILNANSNPRLIGLLLDDSFQVIDPNVGEYYCITLDGLPLAVYSDVIVTMCVEFNSNGIGTTEVEFWSMYNTSEVIDTLKFPKTSNITLLYKDSTKLIFYAPQESCLVRDFLV